MIAGRRTALGFAALIVTAQLPLVPAASAAETLRVGKAVGGAFSFAPLEVGVRTGIFSRNGLDIEAVSFGSGDARMQQAMVADSIDVALGSGPAMAFAAKGSPIKGIAAIAGPPLLFAILVRPDGPKTIGELKGKRVGVSTVGSLTYWLVSATSQQQGWGPDGIVITPMGVPQGQIIALERKEIDGMVADISTAFDMEKNGKGRILARFGHLVEDFHIHVIFATDKAIASRPEQLRAFLKGWFETIAFMRKNKAEAVAIAQDVMNKDETITSMTYDELMPMFSDDGRFNPKALAVLSRSFVEMKTLPEEPDMKMLYTEAFLPKN
jgi:NitT/TauT family transport system substrate-binding protein